MRPIPRRVLSVTAASALTLTLAPFASASEPEFRRMDPQPTGTWTPAPSATGSSPEADTPEATPEPSESSTPALGSARTAPSVGASSAKSTAALTLSVEPLWSGTGEKLTAVGEVYNAKTYRPLAGRPLLFQARNLGSSSWSTIARPETNADGSYRVNLTASRSRTYRAVYQGNAWYASKHSNWERQTAAPGTKVRTSVRLYPRSTGGTQVKGRLTKLWSSSIRPLRSANVTIEARQAYGSYWFTAGTAKTNGHGYYAWNTSVKPSSCYRYRAIYKGNSTWAAKSATTYWSNCS